MSIADGEVTIKYKGNNIAALNSSSTATLNTEDKFMDGDVSVVYARSAGSGSGSGGSCEWTANATNGTLAPTTYDDLIDINSITYLQGETGVKISTVSSLPQDADIGSMVLFNDTLYVGDGAQWVTIARTPASGAYAIMKTASSASSLPQDGETSTLYLIGGVLYYYDGAQWKQITTGSGSGGSVTVDSVPTNGSSNPVSSDGVYDALAEKADTPFVIPYEKTAYTSAETAVHSNTFAEDLYAALIAGRPLQVTHSTGSGTSTYDWRLNYVCHRTNTVSDEIQSIVILFGEAYDQNNNATAKCTINFTDGEPTSISGWSFISTILQSKFAAAAVTLPTTSGNDGWQYLSGNSGDVYYDATVSGVATNSLVFVKHSLTTQMIDQSVTSSNTIRFTTASVPSTVDTVTVSYFK